VVRAGDGHLTGPRSIAFPSEAEIAERERQAAATADRRGRRGQ